MSIYKQCAVCGLNLPMNIMQSVKIRHDGKVMIVGICDRCKEKKEQEVRQRRPNEPIH